MFVLITETLGVVSVGVADTLVTPITTGVAVYMDGVEVHGRKGVGPGRGWMIQPLQEVNRSVNKIKRMSFFIFSPSTFIVSLLERGAKPSD